MLTHPTTKFIVDIEKKYDDQTDSGLYKDVYYKPEFHAASQGIVLSEPRQNKIDVKVGDRVYFSYHVIQAIVQRDNDTDLHKNQIFHDGKFVWTVDSSLIYFRQRGDEVKMMNGNVLLDVIEEQAAPSKLIIPDHLKVIKKRNKGRVIGIDDPAEGFKPIGVNQDDIVYFDERFIETYEFKLDGVTMEYFVSNQQRILGKD